MTTDKNKKNNNSNEKNEENGIMALLNTLNTNKSSEMRAIKESFDPLAIFNDKNEKPPQK